jgi:hypothetical protein
VPVFCIAACHALASISPHLDVTRGPSRDLRHRRKIAEFSRRFTANHLSLQPPAELTHESLFACATRVPRFSPGEAIVLKPRPPNLPQVRGRSRSHLTRHFRLALIRPSSSQGEARWGLAFQSRPSFSQPHKPVPFSLTWPTQSPVMTSGARTAGEARRPCLCENAAATPGKVPEPPS